MSPFNWSPQDLQQMKALGIPPLEADRQLELFRNPPPFVKLDRPAVLGDGILRLDPSQIRDRLVAYEKARRQGRFMKFVPASGAASRMFHLPSKFKDRPSLQADLLRQEASRGEKESASFLSLMDSLERLAFWPRLREELRARGKDLRELRKKGRYHEILSALLDGEGLDYSRKPKALIPFHAHPAGERTPLEEQLLEAFLYALDPAGVIRLHFTFSEEHLVECAARLKVSARSFAKRRRVRFRLGTSIQSPATNTLAVDARNEPFRDRAGRLVFRPGGHGALLQNLSRLKGDLVFVKNIDNVVPEDQVDATVLWKKVLGGHLAFLQEKIQEQRMGLRGRNPQAASIAKVAAFARKELFLSLAPGFNRLPDPEKVKSLRALLDRPIRVCGVVPNTGEPGGGPFWVKGTDGKTSLQIVESAQVDMDRPDQAGLFKGSTHFNPVDLVLGVRNGRGKPYQLEKFRDDQAVFISRKSQGGVELKALELPGLWNGAMAGWITIFVEVPLETFNPVKTLLDLLKPAHQPKV